MVNLFVIIVTYKGKLWYDRCFASLRASTIPVQTVVVDNASNDGTIEFIKEHYPEIHLIESNENLGFGRANNLGMRFALDRGCDYVFLLNQDAWVEPDTFEKMIGIHQRHQEYGVLSPMHLNASKDQIEKGMINYVDDKRITDKSLFDDLFFHRLQEVYDTKYVSAAAWLISRNTLETVGGFDPIFSHYGEDDNYLHRTMYHGMKIGICPLCIVVHDTDRRIDDGNKMVQTMDNILLAELTNVNNPISLGKLRLYYVRKLLSGLLVGDLQKAKTHWKTMLFLRRHDEAIRKSRLANIVKGENWL